MARKRIRDYRVLETLGEGGMGEVLLAEHEGLQRRVALKRFIDRTGEDEEEARKRFYREGQAMARLSHSNIAAIFDLFEWRKATYMALEYIDGFDLAAVVSAAGRIPPEIACVIALGVARGLEAAHAVGIIHRDVKPSNVMVSRTGEIKLMDFGIARQELLEPMTRTGLVVGTPRYLAPEIVNGETADGRSDIYGVGALLYFALTGQRLFAEAKQENLFYLITAGKYQAVESIVGGVPRAVRRIVRRCLQPDPARRYATADELIRALEVCVGRELPATERRGRIREFLEARGPDSKPHADDVPASDPAVPMAEAAENDSVAPGRRRRGAIMLFVASVAVLLLVDATWFGWFERALRAFAVPTP